MIPEFYSRDSSVQNKNILAVPRICSAFFCHCDSAMPGKECCYLPSMQVVLTHHKTCLSSNRIEKWAYVCLCMCVHMYLYIYEWNKSFQILLFEYYIFEYIILWSEVGLEVDNIISLTILRETLGILSIMVNFYSVYKI